ncbi:MAG: cysteine desulfurase NifS [Deltaproteobacteria bacterium]|nr:cysteine desulfurase NifS [Deltaproteobacteria bacterium]
MERIYLDHNATTPIDESVLEAMLPYLKDRFGNPSSIHSEGQVVKEALNRAREQVAEYLGAESSEIVFTSCGTESDNMSLIGIYDYVRGKGNHIITTQVEHSAIMQSCKYLESRGAEVTYLPVNRDGELDLEEYKKSFREGTLLVSVMMANNETGVIFPIEEMVTIAHEKGVLFHTDGVQAVGKLAFNVKELDVDLLSLSGHKIYAPKGVGAVYIKKGVPCMSVVKGGTQEKGRRGGTENLASIVGLGQAMERLFHHQEEENKKIKKLRDFFEENIVAKVQGSYVNGVREKRVPNTSNICFKGVEGEGVILSLDLKGISASSGSACSSGAIEPSRILLSMGRSKEEAGASVRFSFGKSNTQEQVRKTVEIIPHVVEKLRAYSPFA